MQEERNAMSTVIGRTFVALHARIKDPVPTRCPVVGGKDKDRVFSQPAILQIRSELADVFVDICDHAVELLNTLRLPIRIRLAVFRRASLGAVRRVGRQVNEEWLVLLDGLVNELRGRIEEHIRAVAFHFCGLAVFVVGVVQVAVVPIIRQHADRATVVTQHLIESTVFRAKRIVVAQVPFAEHARRVASLFEGGTDDVFVGPCNEVGRKHIVNPSPIRIPASHQRGARGDAVRRCVVIVQPNTLCSQLVNVGCSDPLVTVCRKVTIPLVIRHDQDDVGFVGQTCAAAQKKSGCCKSTEMASVLGHHVLPCLARSWRCFPGVRCSRVRRRLTVKRFFTSLERLGWLWPRRSDPESGSRRRVRH